MNPSHAARATVLAFLSFSACQTRSSAVETSSNPVAIRTAEVSGSSEGEALRFSAVVQPARQWKWTSKCPAMYARLRRSEDD